ncbi:hypothetical protein NBRC116188_13000 [Oceaniserpentilla sp. 4NH20-0058]|uniref:hypothetical protein n=1 Tax=Oceaniserpentilla sp. 4NH20-0058 TaxID=3127660 RepID=UPI00310590EC
MTQNYRLGELLVRRGVISSAQLNDALAFQKTHHINLGQALQRLRMANAIQIRFALFKQHWLRAFATSVSLFIAPFSQCYGDNESIEQLPEYSLTQVAQVPCAAESSNTYGYNQISDTDFNAVEIASTAIWYLSQGGMDREALSNSPVQVSLTSQDLEEGLSVNVSMRF